MYNIKWGKAIQGHSPTGICRGDSYQRQNLQREAGWSWNVLWFTFQISLFQLSEGKRRKLNITTWKSSNKVGLHPSKRIFLFISRMQCFFRGLRQKFSKVKVQYIIIIWRDYILLREKLSETYMWQMLTRYQQHEQDNIWWKDQKPYLKSRFILQVGYLQYMLGCSN